MSEYRDIDECLLVVPRPIGDTSAFEFQSIKTFKKPLERQVSEAVKILHCSENQIKLINGKSEWHKPALTRHQPTREIGS